MSRKYIELKDKFTVGPKKKPFKKLSPQGQYYRKKFEDNPEEHEKFLKDKVEYYRKNKPQIQKRKAEKNKKQLLEATEILGAKCVSCGEPFNLNLKKTNLQIHHLKYDEDEMRKKSRYGSISSNFRDVLKMAKNGNNPKEKYVLLCIQCHGIETFSHKNPKKTFDMFSWLYGQGIFDEVLNDDAGNNKKITEFLKQS